MKKLLFITIILYASLFAQEKSEIIRVVGNSLIGKTINGISFREVIGNVIMTQGNVKVTCDKAIQNLTNNNAELIGNVIAIQDSITITSEKGFYFGDKKYIYSIKKISLADKHVLLTADSGYYYFNLNKSVFNSNVQLFDSTNTLKSNKLTYFNDIQKAIAVGTKDHLASYQTMTAENKPILIAKAITITYFPQKHYVILDGDASVIQGINTIQSPHLEYDLQKQILLTNESPKAKKRTTIIIQPDDLSTGKSKD